MTSEEIKDNKATLPVMAICCKALSFLLRSTISSSLLLYPVVGKAQEKIKTWEERFTYDSGGKGRPGPHEADPNIWAYTNEFAKRFGMPEKWVTPQIKGAEAVAWRKVPEAYRSCGWGGNKEACRQEFKCELDIYIDESKTPLPWAKDAKPLDVTRYFASTEFLSEQSGVRRRSLSEAASYRGLYGGQRKSPFADPLNGKELYLQRNYPVGEDSPLGGNQSPVAWERNVFGALTVLVMDGAFCFGGTAIKNIHYRIGDADNGVVNDKAHSWVEIVIPKIFMERVHEAKQAFEAKDREFYQRALGFK